MYDRFEMQELFNRVSKRTSIQIQGCNADWNSWILIRHLSESTFCYVMDMEDKHECTVECGYCTDLDSEGQERDWTVWHTLQLPRNEDDIVEWLNNTNLDEMNETIQRNKELE
jgi:hypothetical protein